MKVKIDEVLKTADGLTNIRMQDAEVIKDLTLRDVCIDSLLIPNQDDKEKEKWEKYELFKKVREAKIEVDLKAEEIVLIKKAIGKSKPQLVMGQAFEMLEGK